MIRVAVTGSECTGKTSLATELGRRYGTIVVPEYARQLVEEIQRPLEASDVDAIARGQIEVERSMLPHARDLIVLDTDLLSTVVYSHHYYGSCRDWIEQALGERPADLYLLCGIDVTWTSDGLQRDRGGRREEMQELFRRALVERHNDFVEIRGSLSERVDLAVAAIDDRIVGQL